MTYARRWKGCVVAMLGDGTMLGMYPVVTSDLLRELIHRSDAPPPRYLREIVASYHNDQVMSGGEGSPNGGAVVPAADASPQEEEEGGGARSRARRRRR